MKRIALVLPVLLLLLSPMPAPAADWDLVKNVKRLERVSPDYADDKAIDKKFLEIIDLTEKTKKGADLPVEAKRIATTPSLAQSKYLDSFIYYLLVKSAGSKSSMADVDAWLDLLKGYEKSPHLLAARLIRIKMLPKGSPEIASDSRQIVDWLKTQKPEFRLRAPEYSRTLLLDYRPRTDFTGGDPLKLYSLATYMSASNPLAGFQNDETYVSLLGRVMQGREDLMTEAATIYRKAGKRTEAADILFQLGALKAAAHDLDPAKKLLDDAVKLNPEHGEAKKLRDQVKLEMTYRSLAPAEEKKPEPDPATVPEAAPEAGQPAMTPADQR
jgi:tetratricopeptide (TPR) repeat protein